MPTGEAPEYAVTRRIFLASAPLLAAPPVVPRFTLGAYDLPRHPDALTRAHDAGFRLLHVAPKAADLDRAAKAGMKAWVTLGVIQPATRAADETRIRSIIETLRDHPALAFWESVDEPTYEWRKPGLKIAPEIVRDTYRFIRTLDPAHPIYLNHAPTNLVSTLQRYNPGGDILATDIYPVIPPGVRPMYGLWPSGRQGDLLNTHLSQVGQYADKMRQVAGPDRAVFVVLQGFAWERLRAKDQDPKLILDPTRDEQRFMAYQAIVHGVQGILYWGLHTTPPASKLWDDLASVTRELSSFEEALSAASTPLPLTLEYHDTGHSLDRGLEWIAKPYRQGVLLITVNADPNPVEATLRGLDRYRTIRVLFESRAFVPQRPETFPAFGVRVYHLQA